MTVRMRVALDALSMRIRPKEYVRIIADGPDAPLWYVARIGTTEPSGTPIVFLVIPGKDIITTEHADRVIRAEFGK